MKTELLYTIGTGNGRSYMSVVAAQVLTYLVCIDLSNPLKGISIALVVSLSVSLIDMLIIQYYNSDQATIEGGTRYIRNLSDKIRLFRRVYLISYGVSLFVLLISYVAKALVADYFLVSGTLSIVIALAILAAHDYMLKARYSELKRANWVFDYNKTPSVRTVSSKVNVGINMFDDKNHFVVNETTKPLDVDNVFKDMPPGTKLKGNTIRKPDYKMIEFTPYFEYTSLRTFKTIYLPHDGRQDNRLIKLYDNILGKYAGLYLIEEGFMKCMRTTMTINGEKVEKYIEENQYVKEFVPSKDTEVAYFSIMMNPDISKIPLRKFVQKFGNEIKQYELRQTKNNLYVLESGGDEEHDMTYMQQYMSLNLDEYKCQPVDKTNEDSFSTFQEKLEHSQKMKRNAKDKKFGKTLYKLNLKGEFVFVFYEDLKTTSELDEIIVSHFINRDIEEMLESNGYPH